VSESRAVEIVVEVGSCRCRRVYCETRVSNRGDGDGDGDGDGVGVGCWCTVHLQVLKFDLTIFLVNYSTEKPRPDGLALAFQDASRAKAAMKPSKRPGLARPIWARLGLAHGLRPGLAHP
jgi:hypothetical protein